MKISKEKLLEIIKEELEVANSEKQMTDVKKVLNHIQKIDNKKEYKQLVLAILKHEIENKKMILVSALGPAIANAIMKALGGSQQSSEQ